MVSVEPGGSPADSERAPTALRSRLTTGLPLAPKRWQIHHRAYIDRDPSSLIPEIGSASRENSTNWNDRPGSARKSDEPGSASGHYGRQAVFNRCLPQPLVISEESTDVITDAERGGEVDGVEAAESGWLESARLIE